MSAGTVALRPVPPRFRLPVAELPGAAAPVVPALGRLDAAGDGDLGLAGVLVGVAAAAVGPPVLVAHAQAPVPPLAGVVRPVPVGLAPGEGVPRGVLPGVARRRGGRRGRRRGGRRRGGRAGRRGGGRGRGGGGRAPRAPRRRPRGP